MSLLVELLQLVDQRPDINTGMLLAHFEGRDEHAALQKLALIEVPGDEASWLREFLDAIDQLERQTLRQRVDELLARVSSGGLSALSAAEKAELRDLQGAVRKGG